MVRKLRVGSNFFFPRLWVDQVKKCFRKMVREFALSIALKRSTLQFIMHFSGFVQQYFLPHL